VRSISDQDDDENNSAGAKSREGSPKDDDGGANEDNSDKSKGNDVGNTRAINIGKVGRRVMYRDEWNDGCNVGNEMDLLDFVDEGEEGEIIMKAIFQSNFPSLLTSIVLEDENNDGKLCMTETNLMYHDAVLNV
jgi:hypothetical protein